MEIPLKHGIARVDDSDASIIHHLRPWYSMRTHRGNVYAYTQLSGRKIYMHHAVLRHTPNGRGGGDVDHINGDGLDNRRENLRLATRTQNNANSRSSRGTSCFKGVSWNMEQLVWQAHIRAPEGSRALGLYEVEEDAARAYDRAAHEIFGEFARLNFPDRLAEPPPTRFSAKNRGRDLAPPSVSTAMKDGRQGAGNGRAKLTEDQARAIIEQLRVVPRRSQKSIAEEFGVRQTTISRILRRESWGHLWD